MVKLLLGALMVVTAAGAMSGPAAARPLDGVQAQRVQVQQVRYEHRHGVRHHNRHHARHHGRFGRL